MDLPSANRWWVRFHKSPSTAHKPSILCTQARKKVPSLPTFEHGEAIGMDDEIRVTKSETRDEVFVEPSGGGDPRP